MDWHWPWTQRIRVNKPIDWANTWSLEEQARGISFEMDEHKNLKAVPVVVIDSTNPNVVPLTAPIAWSAATNCIAATTQTMHTPTAPRESYLCGMRIDYNDATMAVAAKAYVTVQGTTGLYASHGFWCDTASAFRPSLVVEFGEHPIRLGANVRITNAVAFQGTTSIYVHVWGYDA